MKLFKIAAALMLCIAATIQTHGQYRADSHAPIGVMGDHTHAKGEWMFSYRYMFMKMKDNLQGSDEISSDEIVTTIPNIFFGSPMQPPTLRVVPEEMNMNMHMVGAMYAPSDHITLMVMGMYLSSSMDHTTYQGGMGTTVLGQFTTTSSGFGDTKFTVLYKLSSHFHVNLGVSIPTGSLDNEGEVLTPMEMRPTLRLPYPMQLGSGTWDLLPAITYRANSDSFGWGAQVSGNVRLGTNDNDYTLGNILDATAWGSYLITQSWSTSLRLAYRSQGAIDGMDPNIMAPVQTANPDFFGGNTMSAGIGINLVGQEGFLKRQRLGIEASVPLYQNLNGVQMQNKLSITAGWQYAF